MAVPRNEMHLSAVFPCGQEALIHVMNAFGFKADSKGVCCGLSHSARDAFLAGSFPQFLQHLQILQTIHEACVTEVTSQITLAQKQEIAEIEKLVERRKSPELSFEQKHHINMIINNKTTQIKKSLSMLSDYADDPDNSLLARIIQSLVESKIDVVLQAKLSVIKEFSAEYNDMGIEETLSSLVNLSYLDKSKKVEAILQKLSEDSTLKIKLDEKLKQKLTAIPEKALSFFNNSQALFTRIALYQKADDYPDIFNETDLSTVQTENVKRVHPMVESSQLEAMGGLQNVVSFTGCYTVQDLSVYFKTLLELLKPLQKPLVLNLRNSNHAIMMGYNLENQSFVFYNPGTLVVEMKDPEELAKHVMSGFSKRNIYVMHRVPDTNSLKKYQNHYLAVRAPQSLFYVNGEGELLALSRRNAQQFQQATANLDDGIIPENQALAVLQKMIQANAGHESLGSSVAIMTTDVSVLANDNSENLSDGVKQWYQKILTEIHEVTPEKMTLTDAADASWFQRALYSNDIDTVKKFLANSVNVSNNNLAVVINNKFPELIALLLPHVKVPLILAAYNGDIEIVRALLKNNVDINQKSSVLCAFAVAVINNNIPLVDLLLEYDANPHHAYLDDAETPFSLARGNENIANQKLFNNSQFAKPAIKDVQSEEKIDSKHKRRAP